MSPIQSPSQFRKAWPIACLAVLAMTVSGAAQAKDPKVFDTPEAAAQGMIAALEKGTNDAIVELLGDAHSEELFTEDEAAVAGEPQAGVGGSQRSRVEPGGG